MAAGISLSAPLSLLTPTPNKRFGHRWVRVKPALAKNSQSNCQVPKLLNEGKLGRGVAKRMPSEQYRHDGTCVLSCAASFLQLALSQNKAGCKLYKLSSLRRNSGRRNPIFDEKTSAHQISSKCGPATVYREVRASYVRRGCRC